MPDLSFSVYCEECGAGLCGQTRVDRDTVLITPCFKCMDAAEKEAYDRGYSDGYEDGKIEGYDKGMHDGCAGR